MGCVVPEYFRQTLQLTDELFRPVKDLFHKIDETLNKETEGIANAKELLSTCLKWAPLFLGRPEPYTYNTGTPEKPFEIKLTRFSLGEQRIRESKKRLYLGFYCFAGNSDAFAVSDHKDFNMIALGSGSIHRFVYSIEPHASAALYGRLAHELLHLSQPEILFKKTKQKLSKEEKWIAYLSRPAEVRGYALDTAVNMFMYDNAERLVECGEGWNTNPPYCRPTQLKDFADSFYWNPKHPSFSPKIAMIFERMVKVFREYLDVVPHDLLKKKDGLRLLKIYPTQPRRPKRKISQNPAQMDFGI